MCMCQAGFCFGIVFDTIFVYHLNNLTNLNLNFYVNYFSYPYIVDNGY